MVSIVNVKSGSETLPIMATLVKEYPKGKLFFAQERLIVTDLNNNELISNDIIDLVEEIL